jgi:glycosyltransferase involved in cell wall biosynthesis
MGLGYKSHLLTNFVDTPQFKNPQQPKNHEVTVIYVGRLEPVQTPDLVVKAFKKVNEQIPNAKLTIVGYGRMFEPLQQQIKQLGIENAVTMTGKQTDVRKYLWQSDVFVATNFGYIATLEAWAAGLAVVAPNFGVLKETVADGYNGLIFEPGNADDLAAKLISAIQDAALRKQIASNGVQTVAGYDIRAVAPKMAAIYQTIAKQ